MTAKATERPPARNTKYDHAASSLAIAWAAGFLEGEGWFAYRDSRKGATSHPRMGANQVNREPLERLQALFGGNIYHRHQDPSVRRSWWGWELREREQVLAATETLRPWFTQERLSRIPWCRDA